MPVIKAQLVPNIKLFPPLAFSPLKSEVFFKRMLFIDVFQRWII